MEYPEDSLSVELRQLLSDGALEPDGGPDVLARYILAHGFAALSEDQQKQFQEELLPLLKPGSTPLQQIDAATSDEIARSINDPGNEDPGSQLERESVQEPVDTTGGKN
ncbi:hypothetical protein D3C76_640040 [compost metagenome]